MKLINERPYIRVIFALVSLGAIISTWLTHGIPQGIAIIITCLMVFMCYASLVKAGILHDRKFETVRNDVFDLLGIAMIIILLLSIFGVFGR